MRGGKGHIVADGFVLEGHDATNRGREEIAGNHQVRVLEAMMANGKADPPSVMQDKALEMQMYRFYEGELAEYRKLTVAVTMLEQELKDKKAAKNQRGRL